MDQVKVNLGIITDRFEEIGKEFQRLAEIQITKTRLAEYLSAVFPAPEEDADDAAKKRIEAARQKPSELFGVANRQCS